jgi:hypothetical protein
MYDCPTQYLGSPNVEYFGTQRYNRGHLPESALFRIFLGVSYAVDLSGSLFIISVTSKHSQQNVSPAIFILRERGTTACHCFHYSVCATKKSPSILSLPPRVSSTSSPKSPERNNIYLVMHTMFQLLRSKGPRICFFNPSSSRLATVGGICVRT